MLLKPSYKLMSQARWLPLHSTRKRAKISGEVQVKAGLVDPANPSVTKEELQAEWDRFIGSLERDTVEEVQAIIDHPATESIGIGIFRVDSDDSYITRYSADDFDDERHTSEAEEVTGKKKSCSRMRALRRKIRQSFEFHEDPHDVMGVVFMEVKGARDLPPERNGMCF
jgi:phosphatidylserine decarboxylase